MRPFVVAIASLITCEPSAYAGNPKSSTSLEYRAEQLARSAFKPSRPLPPALRRLNYDDYRLIAFEHERALWKNTDSPFQLEFFHRGYIFKDDVAIRIVNGARSQSLPFDRRMFQYRGRLETLDVPRDIGFAGFRTLGKFEHSEHFLELASFLGASYFRAIGEDQFYGTSARGLAVDIGLPKPEEFPVFREFWIEHPEYDDESLSFAALLDSPTVAGAYYFTLRPGPATAIDVRAKLFFRRRPEKLGLAPMSSMWMWGNGLAGPKGDHRPEVHDCDGLVIHTADDQWIFRALTRLDYPSISRFDQAGVRGFGLLQRDRIPEHYADGEAKYDRRPSVWIEPKSPWLDGAVELLELPAEHEGIDNIAAWWTPKAPIDVSRQLDLEYTVSFQAQDPVDPHLLRSTAFRTKRRAGDSVRIEVDFSSDASPFASKSPAVAPTVSTLRARLLNTECKRLRDGTHRLTIDFRPDGNEAVEVTAILKSQGKAVSETWRYLCRI